MEMKFGMTSRRLLVLSSVLLRFSVHVQAASTKKPNILWILLDDVSAERFPESGNEALAGKLPGFDELKNDGAVYYPYFYSPSSMCGPSQVALFSGIEPGDIGGQYQFPGDPLPGKAPYRTVPPPEVMFVPERLRSMGYWSVGAGKLDYQVGDVMPTFYNEIPGGFLADMLDPKILNRVWDPAIKQGRPFFGMLNMMDTHQFVTAMQREAPVFLTDPDTGLPPSDLPFGVFGHTVPRALFFDTGTNGTAKREVTALQDLESVDIVGYAGDYDAKSLSHANGGVPGYLPEDIGIKSILAKEYDIIRNVDYRIQKIIAKLKTDGVYNDTMIVVFGDHGSATFKAKLLLQPQSVRPPMWIKYPEGIELSASVSKNQDGHNIDDRMTTITDLYPTVLSVLGEPPESYMQGRALAGKFEDKRPPRTIMFALLQRLRSRQAWKTFAAFTKDFHYERNLITNDAIEEREQLGKEGEQAVISDAYDDALYSSHFSFFAAAPIFDRLRRLMRLQALNASYPSKYYFLSADGSRPPSECMFDLRSDPAGTENILMDYKYTIGQSSAIQKWGNDVTNVTLTYGALNESRLGESQKIALETLRRGLDEWIEGQAYVTPEVDWSDGLFGEENKMAEVFWPGGVQPQTANVVTGTPYWIGEGAAKSQLSCDTHGAVFRHASVSATEREQCDLLGTARKGNIEVMTLTDSGLPSVEYKSIRNGQSYTGYEYGKHVGRSILSSWFVGQYADCSIFVSSDATFMEMACPGLENVYVWDTRDAVWNGTDWDGVDSEGQWVIPPVTFWDNDKNELNYAGFNPYVFGPERNGIFSGKNPDGSQFKAVRPDQATLDMGYNPAPSYFASPNEDVTVYPEPIFSGASLVANGWALLPELSWFRSTASPSKDDKGSLNIALLQRSRSPPLNDPIQIQFNSFEYECLLWAVGTSVTMNVSNVESMHIFTQAVRKGYADSEIKEFVFNVADIIDGDSMTSLPTSLPTCPTPSCTSIASVPTSSATHQVCSACSITFIALVQIFLLLPKVRT